MLESLCWCCRCHLLYILLFYVLAFVLLKAIYEHNCFFKWQSRDKKRVTNNNNKIITAKKKIESDATTVERKTENDSSYFIYSLCIQYTHTLRTHTQTGCRLVCVRQKKNWFPFGRLLTDFIYQFNLLVRIISLFYSYAIFFFWLLLSFGWLYIFLLLLMLTNWSLGLIAFNVHCI